VADDVLAERYGRTRSSRRRERTILITVAAVFAVVFVAWVVWAGLDGTRPTLEVKDTGHRLLTDQRAVEVRFDLSAPVGSDTACVVQALNEEFVVVGWKVIEIPASDEYTRTFTETVRTAQEANTGLIYRCWLT